MRAADLRVARLPEFVRSETTELAVRLRGLAADLTAFRAVLVPDGWFDATLEAPFLPDLAAWRCSSCDAPTITARVPGTVETLECPRCTGRRATGERIALALAIVLAEAQITTAVADEPSISRRTRDEVDEATAELRRLSTHLSSVDGLAGSEGGDRSRP